MHAAFVPAGSFVWHPLSLSVAAARASIPLVAARCLPLPLHPSLSLSLTHSAPPFLFPPHSPSPSLCLPLFPSHSFSFPRAPSRSLAHCCPTSRCRPFLYMSRMREMPLRVCLCPRQGMQTHGTVCRQMTCSTRPSLSLTNDLSFLVCLLFCVRRRQQACAEGGHSRTMGGVAVVCSRWRCVRL